MANGKERESVPSGRVTVRTLGRMKAKGERITMLTCYDATFARILDGAGADVLLVGDSLGMVVQGHETTLPVTVDEVVYHCRAVARGTRRAHVVGDLPFMSYQSSEDEGMRNAGRLLQEGGAQAVKLEGGERVCPLVARLVSAGIPVMGHLGLTPQSVNAFGGYRVQGRGGAAADVLVRDALALQDAGAYALVLEGVPWPLARTITDAVDIPPVGNGAGAHCAGQVLVIYDLLGMDPSFSPTFVKAYDNLHERIGDAVRAYRSDVREGRFPDLAHSFE